MDALQLRCLPRLRPSFTSILLLQDAGSDAAAMEGLSGDAAEMSAQIQALALALHLDNSIKGAAAMLKSINAQLDSLLPQLPPGFFQPILPEGSLSQPQVRSAGVALAALLQEQLPAALRRRSSPSCQRAACLRRR